MKNFTQDKPVLEAEINGARIPYDGVSSDTLAEAKAFYTPDRWEYLGSSRISYFNGTQNNWKTPLHFFAKKLREVEQ